MVAEGEGRNTGSGNLQQDTPHVYKEGPQPVPRRTVTEHFPTKIFPNSNILRLKPLWASQVVQW